MLKFIKEYFFKNLKIFIAALFISLIFSFYYIKYILKEDYIYNLDLVLFNDLMNREYLISNILLDKEIFKNFYYGKFEYIENNLINFQLLVLNDQELDLIIKNLHDKILFDIISLYKKNYLINIKNQITFFNFLYIDYIDSADNKFTFNEYIEDRFSKNKKFTNYDGSNQFYTVNKMEENIDRFINNNNLTYNIRNIETINGNRVQIYLKFIFIFMCMSVLFIELKNKKIDIVK